MKNNAYPKLSLILVLMILFALLSVNYWYTDKQLKETNKQITDTQDRIKSLNTQLSKWTNETNMMQEAKKLNFRMIQEGEEVILGIENDY